MLCSFGISRVMTTVAESSRIIIQGFNEIATLILSFIAVYRKTQK
jgi:hypothetical protein